MPDILPSNEASIAQAAALLRKGKLVAFPTETVYGLGADATSDRAVAAIFNTKSRPSFNPLIVHVASFEEATAHAVFPLEAQKLAAAFWPGGLTLVLRRRHDSPVSLLVSAGLDTVALRVPASPVARALIGATGRPLAAPSANISGEVSPTMAEHVRDSFAGRAGELALILDNGPCALGIESTVIGFPDDGVPALLRPGAVAREDIEKILGAKLAAPDMGAGDSARASPGQLESHYAPRAQLRLNAELAASGELLLGFGPEARNAAMNLSLSGDLVEAAANLFAMLRALDAEAQGRAIAVMPIPETGLGEAINDRLKRAAAPRK